MRTLSATLLAAQQSRSYLPRLKAELSPGIHVLGGTIHTYYGSDRILRIIDHTETMWSSRVELLLDNHDGALTGIDFRGYDLYLGYGMHTSSGDEYSTCQPLQVIGQHYYSQKGNLQCAIMACGRMNIWATEPAYLPSTASGTTFTVLDLLYRISGDGPDYYDAGYGIYDHFHIDYLEDAATEPLLATYQPREFFSIAKGDSRLSKIQWLIEHTGCVCRVGEDGCLKVLVPVTSGPTTDYEYQLGGHNFFSKVFRKRAITPNHIQVSSLNYPEGTFMGAARDQESFDPETAEPILIGDRFLNVDLRVGSQEQAMAMAEALLMHNQMEFDRGSFVVPVNVGQEVYDYIKLTDARDGTVLFGNVGTITRNWNGRELTMSVDLGVTSRVGYAGTGPYYSGTTPPGASPVEADAGLSDLSASVDDLWHCMEDVIAFLETLKAEKEAALVFVIDGGGAAITTGEKGHLVAPFDCSVISAELEADQEGDIVVDVWKCAYANFPPESADSICASTKPALSAEQSSMDCDLTDWTTLVSRGDVLGFNVDSAATVTRVTVTLHVRVS